ncbi:MAG: cell division protein FtsB [Gammaproteobacteria bacterium]|nr:cell division protein FtsB [Gammaproteobacteria bacterium]MCW8840006.1 cell division protein FtsB [Gammaproteobacteria bacterium]MCW8958780.1 cell division protein FtsB [Gammaproteobacteria bacterium]MCW8972220.1 cell division protein FtsB [Gammaproteobacteria bacterium]MCW8993909.1 cell division protein FtsB [Gammaproteobacteria bacterium]
MRWLTTLLFALLLVLQYQLWFGNGGLLRVWQMDARVKQQKQENSQLDERNKALEAEVRDLKQGLEALEERARSDLGMIKKDETFFQVVEE